MKTSLLPVAFFSAVLILTGQAQEPSLSGTVSDLLFAPAGEDLFPAVPPPSQATEPQPETETTPSTPTPKEAPPEAETSVANHKGTAEQLRMAIRMRQLKTALLADETIQGELAKAHCAKTEEGRRVLMRNYYTLLYTKIGKLDPALFTLAETELRRALARYEQVHSKPSVLIEPGIQPLPRSRSADHAPGKCPAP